jgi:AraC-like DNA-binding protein
MLAIPGDLKFEDFQIGHLIDARGRYLLQLNPTFPLAINAFNFPAKNDYPLNWHERLEIFVAVEGEGQFRMGDKLVPFHPEDVLIVENMKLHGLAEFRGQYRRAISISFLSELAYSLGSPMCDFTFLGPFFSHPDSWPRVVGATDPDAACLHSAVNRLLEHHSHARQGALDQAGCHVYLLELLYRLSRHFRLALPEHAEYIRQQERTRRLAKLFEYIQANYADHISVEKGAEITAMSVSRFMTFFKQAAGMTFVSFLTHVRLTAAASILRESALSVGEIAAATGFPDQSYFGRVFRKRFGATPREFRAGCAHDSSLAVGLSDS